MSQSRPDSGLGFQVKVLQTFSVVHSSLGSGSLVCCSGGAGLVFRVWGLVFRVEVSVFRCKNTLHTVEYDAFMKSQLASSNSLEGLTWCKFGHVTVEFSPKRNPRSPPSGMVQRHKMIESRRVFMVNTILVYLRIESGQSSVYNSFTPAR